MMVLYHGRRRCRPSPSRRHAWPNVIVSVAVPIHLAIIKVRICHLFLRLWWLLLLVRVLLLLWLLLLSEVVAASPHLPPGASAGTSKRPMKPSTASAAAAATGTTAGGHAESKGLLRGWVLVVVHVVARGSRTSCGRRRRH